MVIELSANDGFRFMPADTANKFIVIIDPGYQYGNILRLRIELLEHECREIILPVYNLEIKEFSEANIQVAMIQKTYHN